MTIAFGRLLGSSIYRYIEIHLINRHKSINALNSELVLLALIITVIISYDDDDDYYYYYYYYTGNKFKLSGRVIDLRNSIRSKH